MRCLCLPLPVPRAAEEDTAEGAAAAERMVVAAAERVVAVALPVVAAIVVAAAVAAIVVVGAAGAAIVAVGVWRPRAWRGPLAETGSVLAGTRGPCHVRRRRRGYRRLRMPVRRRKESVHAGTPPQRGRLRQRSRLPLLGLPSGLVLL